MKFTPSRVAGVTIVDLEPERDHRGFSSRWFCAREFGKHGLAFDITQTNTFFNYTRGTVRCLYRQAPPHAEAQLVRCTRGAIAAVAVDVRDESPTYGNHVMVGLSADEHRALFLPPHVAHGFQTLIDNTEVIYQVGGRGQTPVDEHGFRWDDPEFGIEWPLPVTVISERDASWPSRDRELTAIENPTRCMSRA
ncbi:dTDP-4-dehydrorhamnose 3,5-epimerase family protein [Mycobacterium sp. 050134]|uniref:dTDP-4-dehydrorhamnose 3,5-epimerase family protein n=1 Tax=Mycobacterium sp. 050134 TaxID=3096111 RepID=UPI002EDB6347